MVNSCKTVRSPIFIYPGRDSNYDYPAVELSNTLIAGLTSTGKSKLIDSILLGLVTRYSSEELQIIFWDGKRFNRNPWLVEDENLDSIRTVPHMQYMSSYADGSDTIAESTLSNIIKSLQETLQMRIKKYAECSYRNIYEHNAASEEKDKFIVLVADEYRCETLTNEDFENLEEVMRLGRSVGIYVIFSSCSPDNYFPGRIMNLFSIRLCLATTPKISMEMLESEIANCAEMKAWKGLAYYKNLSSDVEPKLLNVDFYTDCFIRGIVNTLSK